MTTIAENAKKYPYSVGGCDFAAFTHDMSKFSKGAVVLIVPPETSRDEVLTSYKEHGTVHNIGLVNSLSVHPLSGRVIVYVDLAARKVDDYVPWFYLEDLVAL